MACRNGTTSLLMHQTSKSRKVVIPPRLFATGGILVGNTFLRKRSVVELFQTFHVFVREMSFRDLTPARFQILVVAEAWGNVIVHFKKFQLIRGLEHKRVVPSDEEKGSNAVFYFFLFCFFRVIIFLCPCCSEEVGLRELFDSVQIVLARIEPNNSQLVAIRTVVPLLFWRD